MTNIVLMTAVTRPENLPVMLESIKRAFGYTKEEQNENGYQLVWAMVRDEYNCKGEKGEVGEFYRTLFEEESVNFLGFKGGYPNQKNYGGDIFENVLDWLVKNRDDDPWIYILDDDNIVHPLLGKYLKKCDEKHPGIDGIWLNYQSYSGLKMTTDEYNAFLYTKAPDGEIVLITNPDPSACPMKLSVYKKNLPMGRGGNYDFRWFRSVAENLRNEGKLLLQCDVDGEWNYRSGAFHNGIAELQDLKNDLDDPEANTITCIVEDTSMENKVRNCQRYVIPKEANREILEIIRKYNYGITRS